MCVQCAGWGDVGYTNRWTMEVTNNSRFYSIPLVVGRRIAQIVFFDTDGVLEDEGGSATSYERAGKYQSSSDMAAITRSWQPSDMLPKMYRDRECGAAHSDRAATPASSDSLSGGPSSGKSVRAEEAKEEGAAAH